MPVPDTITAALNTLQSDADASTAAVANQTAAASALAAAQHAKDQSDAAVSAATGKQSGDLQALVTLLQQQYGQPAAPPPS